MRLDASGYYALGVPFALAVAAWDHVACRRRNERGWTVSTAVSHLSTSMGEVLVGIFLAPFLFWIYDWALAHYRVDPQYIYLTGLSAGGGPTWNIPSNRPGTVAAVVPVCPSSATFSAFRP